MNQMTDKFQLPGAERFSHYLEKILEGVLTAEGPEIVDRSYDCEYAKKWIIRQDDKELGEYYTFGPMPGETDFGREFRGRIPGYVNELTAFLNKIILVSERTPEDSVYLVYSNKKLELQNIDEGFGELIYTAWKRQDFNNKIPFP